MLAGIILKVLHEQFFGASALSATLIQARVATEAHLAGLIGGVLLAVLPLLWHNVRSR
ncbi:hypothetical protein JCM19237_1394 [Photobacterium aphoticum]|uniref:Peptidase S54 rhomboid domain-containing protein n=1 Tax=Photobacterium aphoticum TaxID=754436 RepID=A0A090R028_9GAMM|nr:hypothetical protein JCM19237_1394 [Photobacterium aphoticum]